MSYAKRNAGILDRIDRHAAHPSTAALRKAAEAFFGVSERFSREREQIDQNPHLTGQGKKAKLVDSLRNVHARDLRDAKQSLDEVKKNIKAMRDTIKPAIIDNNDLVGELKRREIREHLSRLSNADRLKEVFNEPDARVLDAVLDMPAEYSGLSKEQYAQVKTAREEQLHGPFLREIEAAEEVLAEAESAAAIARGDLMNIVELDQRSFDQIMLPIENKTAAPWLLKQGDRVVVVEPGAATYQDATPNQLRDGKYYADMQEYQRDRAA